jgi:hypothetical protein
MTAVAGLAIRQASRQARTEAWAVPAGHDAFDPTGPDFDSFGFVLLEFGGKFVDIVSFGIHRKSFDLDDVFDDDFHPLLKGLSSGE